MARPRKPVELMTKHLTKEDKENRTKAEMELVGVVDKLYTPPRSLNKREKQIYKNLLMPLSHIKSLCDADIPIFEQMAHAQYMIEEARKLIESDGLLVDSYDKFGNLNRKENPAIKIEKQYELIFRQNAVTVGLSPSARARLIDLKEEQDNDDTIAKVLEDLC